MNPRQNSKEEKSHPGMAGFPDRLVLLPKGKMAFVEMKAPGQKPRPMQSFRHVSLRCLGYRVYVIDSVQKIYEALEELAPERSAYAI